MGFGRCAVVGAALVGAYAAWYRLGLASGSTTAERRGTLRGDELITGPSLVTNHAGDLPAPPEVVWPWLTQVGWHRAGWYTPRWVDRLLFPDNRASADRLDPGLVRDLRPGDTIPDGPPGTAEFVVEIADPPHLLVLHSRSHLPPGWASKFGAQLDWVWTFSLAANDRGGTRLLIRNRGCVRPPWLDLGYRAAIVPADHIMATGMLRGLARRVGRASRLDDEP
ncbi:MAG: hypothetical protein KDB60_06480 [Propionibacteriaceae bacterium]|nr:hypothetical protein [Propionibacteriaceae bacterium]